MQDILVIAAVAISLFLLPRLINRQPAPEPIRNDGLMKILTGWMRLAILITFFWIAGWAAYLQPWNNYNINMFLYIALGPAAAAWGTLWVWSGYKKHRR